MQQRNAYLGNDSVWYCEDAGGHVFPTTPESPIPPGFARYQATTVWEIERIWKRLDQQERRRAEQMSEADFNRRQGRIAQMKEHLNARVTASDCTNAERDFIREATALLNRKEDVLNKFSAYGVAAMQEREAPLAPSPTPTPTETATVPDSSTVTDAQAD